MHVQIKGVLVENDLLDDWSPEKDCCGRLTFRQPVRKLSHLQSQVENSKNRGERIHWTIDRVTVGKHVMCLVEKTRAVIGYVNKGVVR